MASRMKRVVRGAVLAVLALASFAGVTWSELSVSLQPETTFVEPGAPCTVSIWVDYTDEPFDAYIAVVKWDTTVVSYVSAEEGTVMTNACGPQTIFELRPGADSVYVGHALYCGKTVSGPGAVSYLVFEAQDQGVTDIVFDYVMFLRDGTYFVPWITEIVWHNGVAIIAVAGVEPDTHPEAGAKTLTVCPNPGSSFRIRCQVPADERLEPGLCTLDVCDVRGRIIRNIWSGSIDAGRYDYAWDGSREDGCEAPPGVYFLRLSTPGRCVSQKIVLTR